MISILKIGQSQVLSHVTFWACFLHVLVSTSTTKQVTIESNVFKTRNVAHTLM